MFTFIKLMFVSILELNVHSPEISTISTLDTKMNEVWCGPNELKLLNDTSVRPFQVHFDEKMIEDLKYRLKNHRPFTPPLEGVGFEYGFNTDALESWVKYWAEEYPYKERERYLNKYPQYKTRIQGLDIHFLWVKPQDCPLHAEVVPLLLLHGWPGSVREFYETIEPLTSCGSRDFAVQVIAPSLPGFGFSDGAVRPGLGGKEMAVVLRNLMRRLGFHKFYVQGGDWGAYISSSISTLFPEEVLGHHANLALSTSPTSVALYVIGSLLPSLVVDPLLASRMYPISSILSYWIRESGYFHMQATKPDTIGIGLNDSPAGLLSYIFQLFSSGSKKNNYLTKDGGLELYHREDILDNLMIYWITNSITTSARLYAEIVNSNLENYKILGVSTPVPTCTIHAKDELLYQSPLLLRYTFTNLLNATVLDGGGHFLALEEPEIFAKDVLNCIGNIRQWRKSISNKDEL